MVNSNIIDRIKLPFRREKELFSSLYAMFGFYPHNIEYYKQALLHKSVTRRNAKGRPINNERLEFLGDAILDAIVGDIVYRKFQGKREGFLTTTRSKIVQRETLNRVANEIGLTKLIKSNNHNNAHNSYMEGNAFEALVGAIYLDRGYDACMKFMEQRILAQLINLDKVAYKEINFKSKLIEWCQKNKVKLNFVLVNQKRDDTSSPVFTYKATVEGLEGGVGRGYSKKESQQLASKLTLQSLRKNPRFIDAVFAAKADRTKMEEEPVETVPDVDAKDDFIIPSRRNKPSRKSRNGKNGTPEDVTLAVPTTGTKGDKEDKEPAVAPHDFDLEDMNVSLDGPSREDVIAAAEAAAFAEKQ